MCAWFPENSVPPSHFLPGHVYLNLPSILKKKKKSSRCLEYKIIRVRTWTFSSICRCCLLNHMQLSNKNAALETAVREAIQE